MDPNLIYVKTASGENAIQQRTHVILRNVRMVLILVDGNSSVADLIRKIGNLQLTENALVELEKAKFIELKEDSLVEESRQVAQEIRSSATEKTIHVPPRAENHGKHALGESKNRTSNMPIYSHSVFDEKSEVGSDELESMTSRFSALPSYLEKLEKPRFAAADPRQKPGRRQGSGKQDHPAVSKPSFLTRLKSGPAKAHRVPDDKPIKLKPVRYAAIERRSWLALFVFSLMGVLVLACLVVLLFPFGIFIPNLENAFSTAIGRPVSIQEVHVDIYPEPGLVLGGVRLGQGDEVIQLRAISLQPDLNTLFSKSRGFRRVVVYGTELQIERVAGMPSIFASLSDPNKSPKIGSIRFRDTDISFSRLVMRDAEAEIQRDARGVMQALTARSADKSLTLEAKPTATGTDLTVEAFAWSPVDGSSFFFDSLSFKGRLERDTLMISSVEMRIFDGFIHGDAIISAGGVQPNLSGAVVFERINASRLGTALGIGRKLEGSATGSMRFSAISETWPRIFSSFNGEGQFNIQRGSFYGLDLAEAARRVSETPAQGGITAFEQMSGQVRLNPEKNQFYDLNIVSGLMQSTGFADIAKDGRLTGRLELQMKGSVNQSRVPVLISGTLAAPTVQTARR